MQVYWLNKQHLHAISLLAQEAQVWLDSALINYSFKYFPHLCYGAFEEGKLLGMIMAYTHEKSAWIHSFFLSPKLQNTTYQERLFQTLLQTLKHEKSSLYIHSSQESKAFFEAYGFKSVCELVEFVNHQNIPSFNFLSKHAKELEANLFESHVKQFDKNYFHDLRSEFLDIYLKQKSSLIFTLENAFLHSRVLQNYGVLVGPWQVRSGAFLDAEKMIRGLLYYRGLKNITAHVPLHNNEINTLYKQYNFKEEKKLHLLCLGEALLMRLENMYALEPTLTYI